MLLRDKMKLCREFYFDAAHYLPEYEGECEQMHGHTYKLEVTIEGKIGKTGMVLDFNELKKIVNSDVIEKLDHKNLNDIFETPTAENIAVWIFNILKKRNAIKLYSVKLWEGKGKWVLIEK